MSKFEIFGLTFNNSNNNSKYLLSSSTSYNLFNAFFKTFGLLYDEELYKDEKERLMYQNYLDEDN